MTRKPEPPGSFKAHKMAENSVFFDRIVPVAFIVLLVIMALLILFALGIAFGVVPWL
jgi:hypothetical protein